MYMWILVRGSVPNIRWDGVTRLQLDQVAWYNLDSWDSDSPSISSSGSCGRGKRSKGVHGLFSIELLDKSNDDVQQDNGGYYTTLDP